MSCGAEPGSSGGASGGPGDEKDKDMDINSSHRVNKLEDMEYSEADTLTHSSAEADDLSHSAAYTSSQEDSSSDESGMKDDSDSEGETSIPRRNSRGRRARDNGKNKKNTGRYFTDYSYLNSLPRQERRRIEGEIIKGRKLGEWKSDIATTIHGVNI